MVIFVQLCKKPEGTGWVNTPTTCRNGKSSARQNNWPKTHFFCGLMLVVFLGRTTPNDIPHLEKGKKKTYPWNQVCPVYFWVLHEWLSNFSTSHSSVYAKISTFTTSGENRTPSCCFDPHEIAPYPHEIPIWLVALTIFKNDGVSSIGMIKVFPIWWESHKIPWFPTTNQSHNHLSSSIIIYNHGSQPPTSDY